MNITVTMNESDIKEAVGMWLRERGMRIKGTPQVHHFNGDPREPSSTSISVEAEGDKAVVR